MRKILAILGALVMALTIAVSVNPVQAVTVAPKTISVGCPNYYSAYTTYNVTRSGVTWGVLRIYRYYDSSGVYLYCSVTEKTIGSLVGVSTPGTASWPDSGPIWNAFNNLYSYGVNTKNTGISSRGYAEVSDNNGHTASVLTPTYFG